MIYFKKSLFGSIKRKIKNALKFDFQVCNFSSFFNALRGFVTFLFCFCIIFYLIYLFAFPVFIKEENIESLINNYLSKNTKFSLDINNLKLKPNYTFDINIKADSIILKYSDKEEFLNLKDISADINILSLFFKQINITKFLTDEISVNIAFKNKKYSCFDYFDINKIIDLNNQFYLSGLKLDSNKFNLKLSDLNLNKDFYVNAKKLSFSYSPSYDKNTATIRINTQGNLKTSSFNFGDFNLNNEIKLKSENLAECIKYFSKLDYNPFEYAYLYSFNMQSDVDLKINLLNQNKPYEGKIALKNYTFRFNNIQMPKNNAIIVIRQNKIFTDCDFNFIKNQFIKIKLKADISKNKNIEANLKSSEINLEDLSEVISVFSKILNLKGIGNLKLAGKANCDIFLKSDFKTIFSKGKLNVNNASVFDKKNNIKLDKINSLISFDNNKILIKDTVMFLDKAKLNLIGDIDNKTNLNLKLSSDSFNLSDFLKIVKTSPLTSALIPELKEYNIESGILKINADIKGTINSPLVNINSKVQNFKVFLKKYSTLFSSSIIDISSDSKNISNNEIDLILSENTILNQGNKISVPKLALKIKDDSIFINKTDGYIEKIPFKIEGNIKNYSQNPVLDFNVYSKLSPNNELISFKNSAVDVFIKLTLKNNIVTVDNLECIQNQKQIALITGQIVNAFENVNKTEFKNFKVNIPDRIEVTLKKIDNLSMSFKSKLDIEGSIQNPKINGNINIYNLIYKPFGLKINDLTLNLDNSAFYINIINSFIFNQGFEAIIQGKIKDNKLVLDNVNFNSSYIDYRKLISYSKEFENLKNNLEIKNFEANISSFEMFNIVFNLLKLEGSLKNNILTVSKMSLEGFMGQILGNGIINLDTLSCKADLILKEISTRHLLNGLKELKNFSIAASGKLSALLQIETNLNNLEFENFVNNSKVYAKFNINDGELAQFAKLERLLQAGNIISQSILKLSLNSIISTITSKNTGDFKTIEGTVKLSSGIADIQYIKTQGTNMSLYMSGDYNFSNDRLKLDIFGRIPLTIVSIFGNVGKFNTQSLVNKMSNDAKDIINSLTVSPFEKMMSTEIPKEKTDKIPPLSYNEDNSSTREFIAILDGKVTDSNPIKYFKWNINSQK